MKYYAQYNHTTGELSKANVKCLNEGFENIEISKEIFDDFENYAWVNGEITFDPNFEHRQADLTEIKRVNRNRLLQDSDKRMLPDFPISAEEKELWLLYRQYLRDITKDPAFPNVDVLNFANWLGQIHSKEPVLKA